MWEKGVNKLEPFACDDLDNKNKYNKQKENERGEVKIIKKLGGMVEVASGRRNIGPHLFSAWLHSQTFEVFLVGSRSKQVSTSFCERKGRFAFESENNFWINELCCPYTMKLGTKTLNIRVSYNKQNTNQQWARVNAKKKKRQDQSSMSVPRHKRST